MTTSLEQMAARLARLEAEGEVRRVMMRYMDLCDRLDETTPMDELAGLFAVDAVWAGRGRRYGQTFGEHRGRSAIAAMLGAYRGPPPHFAMNAHFLSSETITVAADCRSANGTWMMLQTSTYADGRSDLRSARLSVEFTFEDGQWCIACFSTENLFSRPVDRWDDPAPVPVPQAKGETR